jgi:glycosyltransferase involved in cell wall biosynthesis
VRRLEQQVLRAASRVIAVTPQLCDMLHRVVPERNKDDFVFIPNASETKEFPQLLEWIPKDANGTIDIGYVGGFYFDARYHRLRSTPWYRKSPHHAMHYYSTQQDWLYRTPYFFFRTWQEIDRMNPDLGSRIRFHLIGDTPDWLAEMAKRFGVLDRCCWHGRLLKQEVRDKLKSFAMMLSTSIKVHGGEDFCLASKTFEYLDAGKPMLGFVCAGAQRDFLVNSQTGIVMDPDDLATSARDMCKALGEGVRLTPDAMYLEAFSADSTARKLAETIRSLVPSRSTRRDG